PSQAPVRSASPTSATSSATHTLTRPTTSASRSSSEDGHPPPPTEAASGGASVNDMTRGYRTHVRRTRAYLDRRPVPGAPGQRRSKASSKRRTAVAKLFGSRHGGS